MTNELVVYTEDNVRVIPSFKSEELRVATERIVEFIRGARVNYFKIATELRWVKGLELYKEDGFSSVYDYAEKVFGYSKSSVVRMIKTAELYLMDDGSSSVFVGEKKDFSISQLRELLPLSREEVVDLVQEGRITPDMTKDQIRSIVKVNKSKTIDISAEEKTDNNSASELKENQATISSASSIESISSAIESHPSQSFIISSQTAQNALESTEIALLVSKCQEEGNEGVEALTAYLEDNYGEEYSIYPTEMEYCSYKTGETVSKKVSDIGIDEIVSDIRFIPDTVKDFIILLKKEVLRLQHFNSVEVAQMNKLIEENSEIQKEIYNLKNPLKKKRGRPKKN